jgi:thiamine biosynthesis protein ThiI
MDESDREIKRSGGKKMDYKRSTNFDWNQNLTNKKVYLLRYSELGLKGKKTRNQMQLKLIKNLGMKLKISGKDAIVIVERGRIYLISENELKDEISRTMGIKSFSKVIVIQFNKIEDVVDATKNIFLKKIKGKTFAVYTTRTGTHNFTSMDVDLKIGDALFQYSSGVNLKNPDVKIKLEIRENIAFIITDDYEGPGGLPLGTEGKMLSLISGGIDSPVATWMMMRRGSPVDMLFISMAHPIDTATFLKKAEILYSNWYAGYDPDIYIVDCSRLISDYLFKGKMKYSNVSFKKIMYNIADKISIQNGSYGIITGESSGQVSSQTPENLFELSRNLETVIHRPLIGMDKDWIISMGRKIGTFNNDTSEEFCALFGEKPITKVKREELESDMERLKEYFPMDDEIIHIKGHEILKFLSEIGSSQYGIRSKESLPEDAVLIDLRDPLSFKDWHPENAINVQYDNVETILSNFKNKKIVFYCKKGLQSAYYAGKFRNLGYESYFAEEKIFKSQIPDFHS